MATPIGQSFLYILQTYMMEAYLCTPAFMSRMSHALYHFLGYAIDATLKAAQEFLEATGELTDDQIDVVLRNTPSFPSFQTNRSLTRDFPWWLKLYRKAARAFVKEPINSPDLIRLRYVLLLFLPYYHVDL